VAVRGPPFLRCQDSCTAYDTCAGCPQVLRTVEDLEKWLAEVCSEVDAELLQQSTVRPAPRPRGSFLPRLT